MRRINGFQKSPAGIAKCWSGVRGLDEITHGGLPQGRPILVCGPTGSGKTLLAMEFLVRGAMERNEPGVFMAFEETEEELAKNVASLGFNLPKLEKSKKLFVDHVQIERAQMEETGEYDLDGLFIRLNHAIDSIRAKRVVLDTIETLFAGLSNPSILRSELQRLFRWLKEKGVTAIITAERGDGTMTRQGLEGYISDCVILLDHRVEDGIPTRRVRIVKYRGSSHWTNEYPFLIDGCGISVVPITSIQLEGAASTERISSGIPVLDSMLEGKGYYRGSTILLSGTAGTGKSSVAAHFADAACRRGKRCQYFAFEESASQILRNMRSIGIDLEHWVTKGLLRFHPSRPSRSGLEAHLARVHQSASQFKPNVVILDPITDFEAVGTVSEVKGMLMRLVDFFKTRQITALFTSLTSAMNPVEQTDVGISSLIDTWILLRNIEASGERNRCLHILKSRGMGHSNQVREFVLTDHGVELVDVYPAPGGILTGSARIAQQMREQTAAVARKQSMECKRQTLKYKRKAAQARITALQSEFEVEAQGLEALIAQEEREMGIWAEVARRRSSDGPMQNRRSTRRERRKA